MSFIVNRRDVAFLMHEVFEVKRILAHPRFSAFDNEALEAILDSAQALAEHHFLPCAAALDADEPVIENAAVRTPPAAKAALQAYADAGFFAASFDESIGGAQAPASALVFVNGMFAAANIALFNYCFLTVAAANLLNAFGSEPQKALYLPPMLSGRWFGSMCLSEPQAGSSLADVRTSATPMGNGRYSIAGGKMWISGGEHGLSDNIVHMVLARIPGSPPGVKGLSLFLTPKFSVEPDGSLGASNNIALVGLNHKMGQRGTTNCLLQFGEQGPSIGTLIGGENEGLACMFQMMNEARIAVGANAAAIGNAGYLYALNYAKERPQGRRLRNKDPSSAQTPIIEHADVKRMLLSQRAVVEGAIALGAYCSTLVDYAHIAESEEERARITGLLDLLTPILKTWASEHCLEANASAMQVLGGYGYARDFPLERLYRDNRLNPIHEGTTGIQGLDLLGRKVRAHGGQSFAMLVGLIEACIAEAKALRETQAAAESLSARLIALKRATEASIGAADPELGLANATLYLDSAGQIVIAYLWLRQALAAVRGLRREPASEAERAFYRGKLATCRYFVRYELPKADHQLALIQSLDRTCLDMAPEEFAG